MRRDIVEGRVERVWAWDRMIGIDELAVRGRREREVIA